MNSVMLIGRLTRDPEVRYTSGSQMAVANFTLAIDRPVRQGEERKADFPRVVVFGRQAETCEKYLAKGRLVAVEGRIQTGSYQNRNGDTVYTTDVVASRVEFLEWGDRPSGGQSRGGYQQNNGYQDRGGYRNEGGNSFAAPQQPSQPMRQQSPAEDDIPDTFEAIEDDVPF
ncbi:single-strand binding protein [Eubacterium pyruvativorans]|uniref:Single-stranded DNA-binding protein n=2 Tax=Eubacterium TaxID=1730 RepID=A0A1I7I5L7_9FIRM|nr:single-stranded DNA-binding protein [Eubacterium pyruvativorans]HAT82534.1 single-stranded DNA-binding protein [Eubacterium sp.]MDY4049894.1 single-stranded DNA-binding protein [Eubacterium pyruvativorans]SDF54769.1 single-strand DNA-binding protein [Eubacterium pyruvativorans]SFO37648.1 single-strand binding protein [Eubacterium pyruvativorans]SFU68223.1 single-strand binding protein [Eubacterium pyruvativorans]